MPRHDRAYGRVYSKRQKCGSKRRVKSRNKGTKRSSKYADKKKGGA